MDFIHGEIHPEDHIHTEESDDEEEDIPEEDDEDFMTVDFAIKLIYPDNSNDEDSEDEDEIENLVYPDDFDWSYFDEALSFEELIEMHYERIQYRAAKAAKKLKD